MNRRSLLVPYLAWLLPLLLGSLPLIYENLFIIWQKPAEIFISFGNGSILWVHPKISGRLHKNKRKKPYKIRDQKFQSLEYIGKYIQQELNRKKNHVNHTHPNSHICWIVYKSEGVSTPEWRLIGRELIYIHYLELGPYAFGIAKSMTADCQLFASFKKRCSVLRGFFYVLYFVIKLI